MKYCPFSKKAIAENSSTCPHCRRVLVETFYSRSAPAPHVADHEAKTGPSEQRINYLKQIIDRIRPWLRKRKWGAFWIVVSGALVFLIILTSGSAPSSNNVPVSVIPNSNENPSAEPANVPTSYVSLPNGTILFRNAGYLDGLGKLTIENGTGLDAIAKLVNTKTNKSIFTVYMKANSTYVIRNISDGDYKLFFNLGNNWGADIKAFVVNSSYEVFEEPFVFTTSNTQYITFSVTLNPVSGGTAQTNDVNATEFGSY